MDEPFTNKPLRLGTLEHQLSQHPGVDQVVALIREDSDKHQIDQVLLTDLLPAVVHPQENEAVFNAGDSKPETAGQQWDASGTPVLSIQHGGPYVRTSSPLPETLLDLLQNAVKASPGNGIRYIQPDGSEDFQSYLQLLTDAERILAGLRSSGLEKGDKVIFQIDDNRGFISCHWACLMGGFVQVPISIAPTYGERNLTVNKLINTWESLQFPLILTTSALQKNLEELADTEELQPFKMACVERLLDHDPDDRWADLAPNDVVIFLLTSGSTGKPKLVQQCHHSLIARTVGTVELNRFTNDEITLNWMPLDHVGGIVMFHIRDVYLACQQIHVPTQIILENPLYWLDLIDKYRVTHTWAPNFAFGLINDRLEKDPHGNWDLSSVRSILNGGEAVVAKTARRFLKLLAPFGLPTNSMHPAWGMSETCSGVTHSFRFFLENTSDEDHFVSVGEAIPSFSMRIVNEDGQVLKEGEIGHLQVHGHPVTSGYYNNHSANEEAFTEDGWFDTGDLGIIRDGQMTITGRGKGEIIINGINYYSHEIESVVDSLEGVEVSFTAATAVREADEDTDKLAIFFNPKPTRWEEKVRLVDRIRKKLVKVFGIYANFVLPVAKDAIPKTAIGKIQRSLLGKQLLNGEFNELIQKLGVTKEKGQSVPNWFFRKTWQPAPANDTAVDEGKGGGLILADTSGLGEKVRAYLAERGREYIWVEIGERFARLGDAHFAVSPDNPEDYDQLLAVLRDQGFTIDTILHLWSYGTYRPVRNIEDIATAQKCGVFSLLALIQSLDRNPIHTEQVRLVVATSHSQSLDTAEPLAYEKGTLQGFLKTVALEVPWLQCRHVDFEVTDDDDRFLRQEIELDDDDSEVAYRRGRRLKAKLAIIDMSRETAGVLPLKTGGLYLITGGLGGVGHYLARRLLNDYRAKLILIGRTQMPERSAWDAQLEGESKLALRIANFKDLESAARKSKGAVVYEAADIADRVTLKNLLDKVEMHWDQPLDGVFHLAGEGSTAIHWQEADQHRIGVEKRETFEAFFRPKIEGTWSLFALLEMRPEAFFVGFSSVVSELGGATFAAYCAANSFLDSACLHYRNFRRSKVQVLNWSMWKDTGMNKGNPEFAVQAALGQGNLPIEPEQGWNCLLAGLCRDIPQIFIGLNPLKPKIQFLLDKPLEIPKKIELYVVGQNDLLRGGALQEHIGTILEDMKFPWEIFAIDKVPLLPDGAVDIEALHRIGRSHATKGTDNDVPATEAEQKIVVIWQEVLRSDNIGLNVNFFDVGGTSIQLAQVNGRLKVAFQRDISITDLFKYPTVASLAAYLTSSEQDELTEGLLQSKERGEQRRTKLLRRRQNVQQPL